jgi:16S rRNA (guanine(527)-N(7))-methyltransferase GidB
MTPQEFIDFVRGDFGLTPAQEEQFLACDALYRDWNAKINVISRKDIDGLYDHHVLHSLAIARYLLTQPETLEKFRTADVLDLGTGGGFPGIPLAILFPEARFTLCDSVGKKTIVAKAVAEALGLQNVEVVNARAESLPKQFGFVVSRAVASLPDFYPWVKGKFTDGILYLKGGDVVEEIAEVMARHRLRRGSVHTWPISAWLHDEYYDGKLVIFIEK